MRLGLGGALALSFALAFALALAVLPLALLARRVELDKDLLALQVRPRLGHRLVRRLRLLEVDESDAARSAGVAIRQHLDLRHRAALAEELPKVVLLDVRAERPDEDAQAALRLLARARLALALALLPRLPR